MLPRVIIHNLTSLDGCIDGFEPDVGNYYKIAGGFSADAIIFGSETIEKATSEVPPETEADFAKPELKPDDDRPLWVVVDSRGRLRNLHVFRDSEYCYDIVVLVSKATPESNINDYLEKRQYDYIVAGEDKVNYHLALEELNRRYGIKVIRTDSGGLLNSFLLEQGLVDEIDMVVSPLLVGKGHTNLFRSRNLPEKNIKLKPLECRALEDGQVLLSYRVLK